MDIPTADSCVTPLDCTFSPVPWGYLTLTQSVMMSVLTPLNPTTVGGLFFTPLKERNKDQGTGRTGASLSTFSSTHWKNLGPGLDTQSPRSMKSRSPGSLSLNPVIPPDPHHAAPSKSWAQLLRFRAGEPRGLSEARMGVSMSFVFP